MKRPIGDEVVLRVRRSSTGRTVRVETLDGRGLALGLFVKSDKRYFKGSSEKTARERAEESALRRAASKQEALGADVSVCLLDEHLDDRHPPEQPEGVWVC